MKIFNNMKLSTRIFISILLIIVLPFYILLGYVRWDMESLLRKEIGTKVVENLTKSENEISRVFERMANISNVFFRDQSILKIFSENTHSYYDRTLAFDKVVTNIAIQNLYTLDDVRITFFDAENRIYTNWDVNYNDYAFLLEQDWIKESMDLNGHIVWSLNSPGYSPAEAGRKASYISLARSILDEASPGRRLGTIIISIDQRQISDMLGKYGYSDRDCLFATTQDGEVLFKTDRYNVLPGEKLAGLVAGSRKSASGNATELLDGQKFLLSYYTVNVPSMLDGQRLKIYYLTDYQYLDRQIGGLLIRVNAVSILFIIMIFVLAMGISRKIVKPIRRLSGQMTHYNVGDLPEKRQDKHKDEISEMNLSFYNMAMNINDLFVRLRQEQLTREKYQFESLRSKMSPHFLFNTLNTIRWMAMIRKADNIVSSIDSLASILQYSLNRDKDMVTLREELEITRSYCDIQNLRYGDCYSLKVDVQGNAGELSVIKFIIQPIVENVFVHAFKNGSPGGIINIRAEVAENVLQIEVSDDGKGFPEEVIEEFNALKLSPGMDTGTFGIGISAVNERIRVAYGNEYGISICNNEAGGARVLYKLPVLPGNFTDKEQCL